MGISADTARLLLASAGLRRFRPPAYGLPMIVPTTWAAATAYVVGQITKVSATKNCYLCTRAGTSHATTAPSGTDPTAENVDGTAKWMYIGPYSPNSTQQDTPSITITNTFTGLNNAYTGDNEAYSLFGASHYFLDGSGYVRPWSASTVAGGGYDGNDMIGNGMSVGFITMAEKVGVANGYASHSMRCHQNGYPIQDGNLPGLGLLFDWTAATAGGLGMRRIDVAFNGNDPLANVSVHNHHRIMPIPDPISLVVLGDSWDTYDGGYFPARAGRSAWRIAGEILGIDDVRLSGLGGTGLAATSGGKPIYGDRLDVDILLEEPSAQSGKTYLRAASDPDIVVLRMSINDNPSNASTLATEMARIKRLVRERFPTAIIIIEGWPTTPGNWASRVTIAATEQTIFDAIPMDSRTFLCPVSTATIPWFWGDGSTNFDGSKATAGTAISNTVNPSPNQLLFASDGSHLNEHGHIYRGQKLANFINDSVYPSLTA